MWCMKTLVIVVVCLFGILAGWGVSAQSPSSDIKNDGTKTSSVIASVVQAMKDSLSKIPPEKALLDVPFFCQAPFMNMDSWNIHRESCEEAAALQVVYYLRGVKKVDLSATDKILRDMIDWQMKQFKGHHDIRCDSTKTMIMSFFGYTDDEVRIIRKATIQDIKDQILAGNPVIAMANGYVLNNPHYVENLRARGMSGYHMLTVKGFDSEKIITNDVGTMRGNGYTYTYDIFQKAMDFHGGDIIVILPKDRTKTGQ